MSLDDNDQYMQLFIEEAKEHIDTLTKSLLILEKDPENQEIVNMLFRSAHTLKGSSGMMGFKDFQELTHAMEDIFDGMRKGKKPNSTLVSTLLECVDSLSTRLEQIQNKIEEEINVATFKQKLHSVSESDMGQISIVPAEEKPAETTISETPSENMVVPEINFEFTSDQKQTIKTAQDLGESCFVVDLKFSGDCNFKNLRANMLLTKIAEIADVVKTVPDQSDLDEQKLGSGFKLVVKTKQNDAEVAKCAKQVCEVEQVNVFPLDLTTSTTPAKPEAPVKPAETVEAPAQQPQSQTSAAPVEPKHETQVHATANQNSEESKVLSEVRSAQTVRVKFEQLDKLMNWVGELVINKIALLQVTADNRNESLKRITENIDRLTADLQDLVMQVRMVPVSQIFDRFPRLVRDLSIKKGKKIDIVMEGKEIEVDRTVLDEIGEPLIHLLRNSIDHGIEVPEERQKKGKKPVGTIKLIAQRNGDHVIIEIDDDGAGIDPEKIKESAIKKGFMKKEELDKLTNDQLINLIFMPGFSTAKEITDTSGRGVGMDVVKTKIAALGGTVHLDTEIGKGTKTSIKLPLTLAIIQAILVKDAGQTFAIPTSQVSEIVKSRKSQVKSLGQTDAIVVRNHVIPVVHLHKMLGLDGPDEEDLELLITYLGDEDTKLGVVVDSVLRQQDILVKSMSETLSGIKGISGATILGDGQVVLVLDVKQFANKVKNKA
ncbi:MAG: chemotaxis protein CheW [Candidatus Bathyarchaeia archaeon]